MRVRATPKVRDLFPFRLHVRAREGDANTTPSVTRTNRSAQIKDLFPVPFGERLHVRARPLRGRRWEKGTSHKSKICACGTKVLGVARTRAPKVLCLLRQVRAHRRWVLDLYFVLVTLSSCTYVRPLRGTKGTPCARTCKGDGRLQVYKQSRALNVVDKSPFYVVCFNSSLEPPALRITKDGITEKVARLSSHLLARRGRWLCHQKRLRTGRPLRGTKVLGVARTCTVPRRDARTRNTEGERTSF